jgi:hypothetical protein
MKVFAVELKTGTVVARFHRVTLLKRAISFNDPPLALMSPGYISAHCRDG